MSEKTASFDDAIATFFSDLDRQKPGSASKALEEIRSHIGFANLVPLRLSLTSADKLRSVIAAAVLIWNLVSPIQEYAVGRFDRQARIDLNTYSHLDVNSQPLGYDFEDRWRSIEVFKTDEGFIVPHLRLVPEEELARWSGISRETVLSFIRLGRSAEPLLGLPGLEVLKGMVKENALDPLLRLGLPGLACLKGIALDPTADAMIRRTAITYLGEFNGLEDWPNPTRPLPLFLYEAFIKFRRRDSLTGTDRTLFDAAGDLLRRLGYNLLPIERGGEWSGLVWSLRRGKDQVYPPSDSWEREFA